MSNMDHYELARLEKTVCDCAHSLADHQKLPRLVYGNNYRCEICRTACYISERRVNAES